MLFKKGDIIEAPFLIPPDGGFLNHPAVILSCDEVYEAEESYIVVMMTTSKIIYRFTFLLNDNMLIRPNNRSFSQIRCHLVTYVLAKHLDRGMRLKNTLTNLAFERLIAHINEAAFDI